jgi:hypothetical protein
MALSEILGKTAAALSAVAVSMVFAVAGAVPAAADPGICVSGPWGYASACVKRARMGRRKAFWLTDCRPALPSAPRRVAHPGIPDASLRSRESRTASLALRSLPGASVPARRHKARSA